MRKILLFFVALFLVMIFAPIGLLTIVVLLFIKDSRERYSTIPEYCFNVAYGVDILGNIMCSSLFNMVLIKHNADLFGFPGETISSVLGKGERDSTLTRTGKIVAGILNSLDKNHCEKSIRDTIIIK